jgi:ABC-type cobalamin/Fe3+-siderophores transport system ATPase subunit
MKILEIPEDDSGDVVVTNVAVEELSPKLDSPPMKARRWSQLNAVEIENFKAINKTRVPLGNVTILVGANSSGKSSVLQAIHWAARAASYIQPKNTKEVVAFERLDYLPSSQPLRSSHKIPLANSTKTRPTRVSFIQIASPDEVEQKVEDISGADIAPKADDVSMPEDVSKAEDVLEDKDVSKAQDDSKSEGILKTKDASDGPKSTIQIWAAKNQGGISVHISGGATVTAFKQRNEPITAYIPGLAGLSEKETILAKPLLRRQAASGDAGGVLRNVLFNLASRLEGEDDNTGATHRVTRLNKLVQSVHPGIRIAVGHDDREDIHINAMFSDQAGILNPLEAAATGVLQVIQIFAYLVLFRPRILLVDEPDAHLHPDKQERLIEALEAASEEFQAQIVLTTHSQNIVRAASASAQLVWMKDGDVVKDESGSVRKLMGWGAMDKKLLMFVEDEDDQALRAILRQWPDCYRQLAICRCYGVENLPKNKLLEGLMEGGNLKVKAVLHRDRDFMTDSECEKWKATYTSESVFPWHTENVDVEAYFCDASYLQALYKVDSATAEKWRQTAAAKVTKAKDKFTSKRLEINRLLYSMADGGQPSTEDLWNQAGGHGPHTVLGKLLLAQLKVVITSEGFDQALLNNFVIPESIVLAPELKSIILAGLES